MSKKFTNFYVPGSGGDIWLQDVPESQDNPDSVMDERVKYYCLLVKIFMASEMHAPKIQIIWSCERILGWKNLI